jgi:hypothetical protein
MARSPTGAVETGFYEWMRHLPFPAHRPYFEEIVADSQGRVWLRDNLGGQLLAQHFMRREGLTVLYHLFDPEGAYLGVVDAPVKIIRITATHLYSLEVEPEYGYQRIRRYRINEDRY